MIKRVHKSDLKLGMFIQDLNCGWMEHSFLRNSFMLRKETDLQKLMESSIGEVYIDTIKGIDCPDAPSQSEVEAALSARILATPEPTLPSGQTTYLEELKFAKQIQKEANQVIHSILGDVRLGKQIEVERLQPVVSQITDSILRNQGTLVSLCRLREADQATFEHSVSACALLIMFGQHLHLDRAILHQAGIAGMLHDIGKMRVPNHILNKPGRLTEAESAIMRDHVRLGLETLGQTPGVSDLVLHVAAEHHERLDGSGYPRKLRGFQISPLGRMATIVDVYDAMTAMRIYHRGIEPAAALQRLYQADPGCFDADMVQHFIQAIGIYPVGSLVRLESNRLAVVMEQNQGGLLHPVVRVVYDIAGDRPLAPFDLDLSAATSDGVIGHEEPGPWNLDPDAVLNLEL